MRKIEKQMINTINSKANFNQSNTNVVYDGVSFETSTVYLHDNIIALIYHDRREVRLFTRGWYTPTTKCRLNAILDGLNSRQCIRQISGEWFVFDEYKGDKKEFEEGFIVKY